MITKKIYSAVKKLKRWAAALLNPLLFNNTILPNMAKAVFRGLYQFSVSDLVTRVRFIISQINGNSAYSVPVPTLASLTAQVDILDLARQNALNKDKAKITIMKAERKTMRAMMATLVGYVQSVTTDPVVIESAGLDVKGSSSHPGIPNPPQNVRAVFGKLPGQLIIRWDGVYRRRDYPVQMSTDGVIWTEIAETGKVRWVVDGLTSGHIYWFRVFATTTDGTSGPSDPAQHMAP